MSRRLSAASSAERLRPPSSFSAVSASEYKDLISARILRCAKESSLFAWERRSSACFMRVCVAPQFQIGITNVAEADEPRFESFRPLKSVFVENRTASIPYQ